MKILIVSLNNTPEPTGIGKYTGEMCEWLANNGHSVDAISAVPHYPSWEVNKEFSNKHSIEKKEGVNYYRVPIKLPKDRNMTAKNRILLELSFTINSLKYWFPMFLKKREYDIVVAICPPLQSALLPWLYSKLYKIPWVFHIQDLQVDAAFRLGILNENKLNKFLFKVENFFINNATAISSITDTMINRVIKKAPAIRSTFLFPNWSDINFMKPLDGKNKVREYLNVKDSDILIMYSGNMGEKQGLELILESAYKLRNKNNYKFVLVGDGASKPRLKKKAEELQLENLSFMPLQPKEELPELINAADIHLVIQKPEAADLVMPSKMTNIVAAAKPVIVTAEEGTALYDSVKDFDLGMIVKPESVNGLVKALESLSEDEGRRKRFGKNARTYAEKFLDKDNILSEFENNLKEIEKKHRERRK